MKGKGILALCLAALVSMLVFTACGSNSSEPDVQSGTELSGERQADAIPEEVVAQVLAEPDTKADAADLAGNWIDVSDESRFVTITQNGKECIYEDNEGKLESTYLDGVLEVKISGTDTARVYLDKATDHLMLVYQDNVSEYRKK